MLAARSVATTDLTRRDADAVATTALIALGFASPLAPLAPAEHEFASLTSERIRESVSSECECVPFLEELASTLATRGSSRQARGSRSRASAGICPGCSPETGCCCCCCLETGLRSSKTAPPAAGGMLAVNASRSIGSEAEREHERGDDAAAAGDGASGASGDEGGGGAARGTGTGTGTGTGGSGSAGTDTGASGDGTGAVLTRFSRAASCFAACFTILRGEGTRLTSGMSGCSATAACCSCSARASSSSSSTTTSSSTSGCSGAAGESAGESAGERDAAAAGDEVGAIGDSVAGAQALDASRFTGG